MRRADRLHNPTRVLRSGARDRAGAACAAHERVGRLRLVVAEHDVQRVEYWEPEG